MPPTELPRTARWPPALPALLVLLVLVVRFAPEIRNGGSDEADLARGVALALKGGSPYAEPRYIYTPALASFWVFATRQLGSEGAAVALRVLNVVGGAMCAWVATARLALAPSTRLAATIVIAVAAPPILAGLAVGNPSVGSSGATLAGLLLWPASPLTAGVLLGVGLMAKPVTLPALAVFAGMRSRDGSSARFAALLAATATVLVSLAIPPWTLRDMLAANQAFGPCQAVGIDGALRAMGATSSPLMILVVVTGIAVAYARRRLMDTDDLIVVGTVASIVALPRIWSHSMTLVIPVVVWALEVQLRRYRSAPPEQPNARQKALLGLVLTGLGAALVCYPEQWAHLDELGIQPVWRGVVSLVPVAALLGLGWVVLGPGQSAPKATS